MEATMNNIHERFPILAGAGMLDARDGVENVQLMQSARIPLAGNDGVRQILRPVFGTPGSPAGGIATMPIIAQLLSIVRQLLSMFGMTFYQNATASSTGDPHLAFSGTDASGMPAENHFDSMMPHADLLDSDSFTGGYQVSTAVTQPGANGVTYNRQATVLTNYGSTQISLEKDGDAYVTQDGRRYAIADGQSYELANGENVRRGRDGSLVVTDTNPQGGTITTTLSENGNGVDVRAQAQNVDLSGDLLAPPLQALL
jgi:hypothetical protein